MVSTTVSEEFMLRFVKLLTAIFPGEVLSVLYPLTPMFSSVKSDFFMSTLCLDFLGLCLTAAVITEESRNGIELRNPTVAAAGPGNCRLFLDLAGLVLWSVNHWLTFHALKGFFHILSSPLCSLFIWILCMIFISMKNSSFFLCQCLFSFELWFRVLTWLARRENNGGVVLKKP